MARQGIQDVELIPAGTSLKTSTKGAYVRNCYLQDDSWKVRPGFGQVTQRDTTMGFRDPAFSNQGLTKHLGSKAMVTNFGHTQILTILTAKVFTGNSENQGYWTNVVSVQIHDVTTNSHWEEVLYRRTAENNPTVSPMPNWRGNYETSSESDYQAWSGASERPIFFTEFGDNLLFGSSRLGLWSYTPAMFDGNRRKQVQSAFSNSSMQPYSESSLLTRVHPTDGPFARAYTYMNSTDYPNAPHDIASFHGRLAIATGRDVFFSDQNRPGSIIAENQISITSEQEITSVQAVGDALLIFTESETYHYMPNAGDIISKGRLTRISPDVGCLSPTAATNVGETVFWVDKNGVYTNTGGLSIERMAEDIEPFFTSHMTDPLSSFLVAQGVTTLADEQPRLTYRLIPELVSCGYDPVRRLVLIAVPSLNLLLTMYVPTRSWAVWPMESTASGTVATPTPSTVGRQSNLPNPWVTVADQRVFLISGVERHTLQDATAGAGPNTGSYIISEWGRGGGLDRSVDALEDNRIFSGQYTQSSAGAPEGDFYLGEPFPLPDNYEFPGGIPSSPAYPNGRIRSDVWLFPLHLSPTANTATASLIDIKLLYDNTNWQVITRGAADPIIEVILPPERQGSDEGWGLGAAGPIALLAECQLYNSGTGLVDPVGDEIRLIWDALTGTARKPWTYATMNTTPDTLNPIMYIPFQLQNPATISLSSLGITVATSMVDAFNVDFWVFDKAYASDTHGSDDVAQPVDYAIKSQQVGLKDVSRVYYRGAFIRVKTRGQADSPIFPDHPWTTLNVAAGSDWNSWTSQTVTYTGDPSHIPALQETLDKMPLRSRVKDTTTGVLSPRSFNNAGIQWSDKTATATGNYLIDEVEVDTLAVSDSMKGEMIDVMVFGMIRSRAESLSVDSIKASMRKLEGGRRRSGR